MRKTWSVTLRAALTGAALSFLAGCAGPHTQANKEKLTAGVSQPVEIVRDRYGVSHIYAQNQRDLFFAQGYNAARDRLWQLDLWRRQGEGKMAEQFGPRFAESDRAARLFLYRGNLDTEFASYHPDGRAILTAFADGINAYVDQVRADKTQLPPEFRLTGTEPGHWRPETSLIRIYGLTRNVGDELQLAQSVNAMGLARVQDLSVFEPPVQLQVARGVDLSLMNAAILKNYTLARNGLSFRAEDFPQSPLALAEREKLAASLSQNKVAQLDPAANPLAPQWESNNWTIAGSKTATGKPILANDPHRTIGMPSLRYMVHLNAPGWNVIGAGEPALPGVSLGHNDRIAFGLTIFAFGDEEDLYVYDTNPLAQDEYRYQGGWQKMRTVQESIPVRGGAPVNSTLKFTRHGPVVYEDPVHHKAYAIRAAYLEFPGTASYLASLRINQAQDWPGFVAAMERHYTPGENMVYADVDGNIGWFGGSIVPLRPRADWSGLLPVPGDGSYEWNGFLPGTALPRILNPNAGFIGTANAFNVPPGYANANLSAHSWAEPYRAQRIDEVLSARNGLTPQDSANLQYDNLSIPARTLAPYVRTMNAVEPDVGEAVLKLRDWDHRVTTDSVAATVHEFWMPELVRQVTELYVPANADKVFGQLSLVKVFEKLQRPDAAFGPDPVAGRNAVLLSSLTQGVRKLEQLRGKDMANWKWGQLHHIQFDHALAPVLSADLRQRYATQRYPVSGDNDTVHRGTYRRSDFRQVSGASYRQVIDVSNWDNSKTQNVPGQSADPESPHYQDLMKGWANGDYFPMAFSRQQVERQREDTLTLVPGAAR
jgi:penicillin amidase